jgi:hypothetical protein
MLATSPFASFGVLYRIAGDILADLQFEADIRHAPKEVEGMLK